MSHFGLQIQRYGVEDSLKSRLTKAKPFKEWGRIFTFNKELV
jgi:hypothetical protein